MRKKRRKKTSIEIVEIVEIGETLMGLLALRPDIYGKHTSKYLEECAKGGKAEQLAAKKELIHEIFSWAGVCGDIFVLQTLLSTDLRYDGIEYEKYAGLSNVLINEHYECVDLFLDKGANPNFVPELIPGQPCLFLLEICAAENLPKCVIRLINAGAIVNHQSGDGSTPLMAAAIVGSIKVVEILLAHGANVHLRDNLGRTALMYAAQKGHIDCIKALLAKGASPRTRDKQKRHSLSWAKSSKKPECIELIQTAMQAG